ncbi:hypothetical protein P691DRAFT_667874, partial [Macrolepiota fuliginosa MF-IS2]
DPRTLQAEAVLLDAYRHDVVTNALTGGHNELRRLLFTTCVKIGIIGGRFYVALTEDDEVVGTAAWYPPGADFLAE